MTARTLLATFSGFNTADRAQRPDIARAYRVMVTRGDLAAADERMLRDVGLTRADVGRELSRAPWDTAPAYPYRRPPRPSSGAAVLRRWMAEAWRRHRSRRLLAQMDGLGLRDIGVSHAEAEAEANKPFWRA